MFNKGYSFKKVITLSFLFLANAIMLAHAVISHHHHDNIPDFSAVAHHEHNCDSHCTQHDCTQHSEQCHDPLCHGNINDCSLSNFYACVDDRQTFQTYDFDLNMLPCVYALFSDFSIQSLVDEIGLPFRQKPYLQSYHAEYISQSLGLRAPPVC
jgi:hypothetical protein